MTTAAVAKSLSTLNTTNATSSQRSMFLCAVPGFCSTDSRTFCSDIRISQCPNCSFGGGVFFLILAFLLFFVIILGNASIQASFFASPTMRTKMDYVRLSLSVSDFLTGLQLIAVLIPNLIRTFSMTQKQIDTFAAESTSIPTTIICGCWFHLSFTSSMYHMVLLSGLRLLAVTLPLKYRLMQDRWIYVCIGAVWVMAILTSTVPTFPSIPVSYGYSQSAFVYLPSRRYVVNVATPPDIVTIFSIIFPYACVMIIIPATAIIFQVKQRRSEAVLNQNHDNSQSYHREMRIICTLAIMYFSYAASVLPLLVFLILMNEGSLSCSTYGISTMLTVFLAMGNSLVNVIVYSVRDDRFRKVLSQLIRDKCPITVFRHTKEVLGSNTTATVVHRSENHTAL